MNEVRVLLAVAAILAGAACEPSATTDVSGVSRPASYAVVASDHTVASISLLNSDGSLLEANFVDSGSTDTGLVTALSGDVALPTQPGSPGVLTLIDRYKTDVITRIDLASGEVLGQIKTHAPNAENTGEGYSSNPQDFVEIDARTALVSRMGPNLAATRSDIDRGSDLLELDIEAMERSDRRIDLGAFDTTGKRTNPDTKKTERVRVYSRPSRLVRLGHHLVVGLARFSFGYDVIGPGMLALVDLKTRWVRGVKLPGLENCPHVVPVPGDPNRVAVACWGFHGGDPRESAGAALLELRNGRLSVQHLWKASEHPGAPLLRYALTALGGSEVAVAAAGKPEQTDSQGNITSMATSDRLYRLDLATGDPELIFEADGQLVIGAGSFDPAEKLLLVPDASVDEKQRPVAGIRRFELQSTGMTELDSVLVDPELPARQVRPI
ncbi:MAG: hypothetical protein MJD61_05455 [Proteobacteria bacterium]|nr:hypothetical protein [Pseudomonadota bacterium]